MSRLIMQIEIKMCCHLLLPGCVTIVSGVVGMVVRCGSELRHLRWIVEAGQQ